MIHKLPINIYPHHPLWGYVSKFIKDPRIQLTEDKSVYDISFDVNGKQYKAKIEHQDENQSSIEVYKEIELIEEEKEEI